jgi:hypothetical protein
MRGHSAQTACCARRQLSRSGGNSIVAAMLAYYTTRDRSLECKDREFILPSPIPTQYRKGHASVAFA